MKRGVITRLRGGQGPVSLALVLAFVLPLLVALLPAPALTVEAQFQRDLASSLCDPTGEGRGQHPGQHDCCDCGIVCPAGGPHFVVADAEAPGVVPPRRAVAGGLVAATRESQSDRPVRTAISARGPPLA